MPTNVMITLMSSMIKWQFAQLEKSSDICKKIST